MIVNFVENISKKVELETHVFFQDTKAVARRCYVKKVFSDVLQNSQENTSVRVSPLVKLQAWHKCFPVNFGKFLRISFPTEHLLWLLLKTLECFSWSNTKPQK